MRGYVAHNAFNFSSRTGNAIKNHWNHSMKNRIERYLMSKHHGNIPYLKDGRFLYRDDFEGVLEAVCNIEAKKSKAVDIRQNPASKSIVASSTETEKETEHTEQLPSASCKDSVCASDARHTKNAHREDLIETTKSKAVNIRQNSASKSIVASSSKTEKETANMEQLSSAS